MEGAKDYLGQEIKEGDPVIFMQLQYRSLKVGRIERLTPKMAVIDHLPQNVRQKRSRQFHNQLVKITEELYKEKIKEKETDMNILERFQKAIKSNDDKEINRIAHEVMAKNEELEDQGLNDSELNHVVGACIRTEFPNFGTDGSCKSPYGPSKDAP